MTITNYLHQAVNGESFDSIALKWYDSENYAAELLAAFRQLVTIPNAGGRYSTAILPEPERLGVLRERAGNLLDRVR